MVRIIVADDHPLYREAVKLRLERQIPGSDVVEAGSIEELFARVEAVPRLSVDLVLLDLYMPGMERGQGIGAVVTALPETPVALMSGAAGTQDVKQAIAAGARGFLPKTMASELFAMAISMILAGGTYLPAEMMQDAIATGNDIRPNSASGSGFADLLSPRERQVLVRLSSGASNKEIGRDLNLAEVTVKLHVRQILRKIKARNRSEAASMATRAGLI
jgi:two-component system, NarL family, nitrate/nitrite response regulator NarL